MAAVKKLDDFIYLVTWNNPNYTTSSQVIVKFSQTMLIKCQLSYTVNQNNVNVQVQIQVGNQAESIIDLNSTKIAVSKYGESQLMTLENSTWNTTFATVHRCCAGRGLIFDFVIVFQPEFNPKREQDVLDRIQNLWESKTLCDMTFKCKEKTFGAHVAIISSCSPVMAAMFQHDVRENTERIIEIKDMEPSTLEQLLRNMYTGDIEFDDVEITELLIAADKYAMEPLKEQCAEYMSKSVSVETVTRYLILAHIYNVPNLHQSAIKYITKNAKEICSRKDWMDLIKNYPELGFAAMQLMVFEWSKSP